MRNTAPPKSKAIKETPRAVEHRRARRPVKITLAEARKLAIEFNEQINEAYRKSAQAEAEAEAAWEQEG